MSIANDIERSRREQRQEMLARLDEHPWIVRVRELIDNATAASSRFFDAAKSAQDAIDNFDTEKGVTKGLRERLASFRQQAESERRLAVQALLDAGEDIYYDAKRTLPVGMGHVDAARLKGWREAYFALGELFSAMVGGDISESALGTRMVSAFARLERSLVELVFAYPDCKLASL